MNEKIFKLEPKWPKCIWQIEHWKKNSEVIERVLWWRFGNVNVEASSSQEIEKLISKRDENQKVCVSDLFEIVDETLKDCKADDIYFPETIAEKETERLKELFDKDPEAMFEKEGWDISETKLYFESDIIIKAIK